MFFRDIILYNRNTLTIYEVYDVLLSKKKMKELVFGSKAHEKGLVGRDGYVRGRSKSNYRDKICKLQEKGAHQI